MSIERRYALLKHSHLYSDLTGGLITLTTGSPTLRMYEEDATTGNRRWDLNADGENLKWRLTSDDGLSGTDFMVVDRTNNNPDAVRWRTDIFVIDDGYFAIKDSKSAPGTISGLANIYVDSSDGDLKVKFGDGYVGILSEDVAYSFTAPTLLNSWVNFGASGYSDAGYYKDRHGRVHLRGLIKNGAAAASVIFNLPSGFRPPGRLLFVTMGGGDTLARVDIDSNGDVIAQGFSSNAYFSLNGISFLT